VGNTPGTNTMEIRRLDNKYTNILAGYTKEKFLDSRYIIQPGGGGGDGKLHTAKLQVEDEDINKKSGGKGRAKRARQKEEGANLMI